MTLKSDAKFFKKLTLGYKNDMRILVNFNLSSAKSENLHLDVAQLLPIAYKVSAKRYRSIISHDTEKRPKLWSKTDLLFKKWHEEFGEL